MAPREGFEPPTKRLTAACSTAELPGNGGPPKRAPHVPFAVDRRALVAASVGQGPPYNAVGKERQMFFSPFFPSPQSGGIWRPRPESNRHSRICSPLHNHSATRPLSDKGAAGAAPSQGGGYRHSRAVGQARQNRASRIFVGDAGAPSRGSNCHPPGPFV